MNQYIYTTEERRKLPYAFQIKESLRKISENFNGKTLSSILALYLAVTWIVSDFSKGDKEVKNWRGLIHKKTGLHKDTISKHLKSLEELGLVKLTKEWLLPRDSGLPERNKGKGWRKIVVQLIR